MAPFSTVRPADVQGGLRETNSMSSLNSFGSRATLDVAGTSYTIYRLDALRGSSHGNSDR